MEQIDDLTTVSKEIIATSLEDAVTFLVDGTDVEFEITEAIADEVHQRDACVADTPVIHLNEVDESCSVQHDTGVTFPLTIQLSTDKYLEGDQLDIVDSNINTNELIVTSFTSEHENQSQVPVNVLTPIQIPEGPTLFILESETIGTPSQILAMATKQLSSKDTLTKSQFKEINSKARGKQQIQNSNQNNRKRICKRLKQESSIHETYLFSQNSVVTIEDDTAIQQFFCCDLCSSAEPSVHFSTYKELARHFLVTHRLRLLKQASAACREDNCSFKATRVDDLRQHLRSVHNHIMEKKTYQFNSVKEFDNWKVEEETRSSSRFIRSSGEHTVPPRDGNLVYTYLTCHRSGIHRDKSKETGKKKKTIPSLKINGVCTATMIVMHDRQLGRVTCDYHSSHYGHDFSNPARQHLSKQEKDWILELVLRGWNSDEIVKTLRNGTIAGTTDRMRRVVRQDIFNICRSKGVRSFERRDENDLNSIRKWIEELQAKDSVLIWTCDPQLFLLVVMNEHQAELAKRYGTVLYLADLPLALTSHYRIITLTVPAENDAYLIAYALTDEPGADILTVIMASIQAKVGTFDPQFVLCHNPDMLLNTWSTSKESIPLFLFPPWKIEKEWNDGLFKYVEDISKRDALKKCVDTLLNERDPSKFTSFLHLFTNMLTMDEALLQFSRCFAAAYSEQALHWPRFHPLPDCTSLYCLNTEIELVARRARAIKRLDKCIYSLEYILANQPFHSVTEFQTRINAEENEIISLRDSAKKKLVILEKTLQGCKNVTALKTINQILDQALL